MGSDSVVHADADADVSRRQRSTNGVRATTARAVTCGLFALALGASSRAGAEEAWETIQETPQLIKVRSVPNSSLNEVWAEMDIDAPVQDIEDTLRDAEHFRDFMPYVKESRALGKPEADGSVYSYVRLDFGSLATSRDYIVQVWQEKTCAQDGVFQNRWVAAPDKLPKRSNSIRLTVNSGSYRVTPLESDPQKSHVVYKFMVDPGGWIPSFAANMGNKSAVSDTLSAVSRESIKRAAARKSAAATVPAPAVVGRE